MSVGEPFTTTSAFSAPWRGAFGHRLKVRISLDAAIRLGTVPPEGATCSPWRQQYRSVFQVLHKMGPGNCPNAGSRPLICKTFPKQERVLVSLP